MNRVRAVGPYLAGIGLIAAFWVTAGVSDFFLDRPFLYTTYDEWSPNFVRSDARFPGRVEMAMSLVAGAFLLPAIACMAARLSTGRDPLTAAWARVDVSSRQIAAGLAALAALFAGLVSFSVIDSVLLLDDERSYLFQAELFERALLKLPSPPAALQNPMILISPAWMSKYPPGQSLALLLGVWFKAPHVVPPVLGGLLVYFSYEFVREAYGERQGLLAAVLLASSPFLWCMAATVMSFTTFACSFMGALWLFVRGRERRSFWSFVGSGAALGFAASVRPYDAVALGWPLGAWLLRDAIGPSGKRNGGFLPLVAGGTPFVLALLAYNRATTGSTFRFGYGLSRDYSFGFFVHPIPGFAYVHTPLQGMAQVATAVIRLDTWLLGWPAGLLFVLAGVWAAKGAYDRLILCLLGSFTVAYSFVASTGTWDVGPTYYFAVAPLAVVLAVRGMRALRKEMAPFSRGTRFVGWLPVVGTGVAMVTVVPLHLIRLAALSSEIDIPWRTIADAEVGEAIVVVPSALKLAATGYALGYPYEIKSGTGTAHLVRPHSRSELEEAREFLGAKLPVFQLVLDEEEFRRSGARHYDVKPAS